MATNKRLAIENGPILYWGISENEFVEFKTEKMGNNLESRQRLYGDQLATVDHLERLKTELLASFCKYPDS